MKTCSRCKVVKCMKTFDGFKTCDVCRARGRKTYDKNKETINETYSKYCELCDRRVRHENWDEHFFWVQHSGSEVNLLLKEFEKQCISSKKSIEEKEEAKKEYYRKKEEIYKKLSEQFPNSNKWKT